MGVCRWDPGTLSLYQTKGTFHLSELTGQTIAVLIRISLVIKTIQPDQILNSVREEGGFSANTLGKSRFHLLTDWFGINFVRPASSHKWKVPLVQLNFVNLY